jgi:2-polyprenyl-3-methyl-5-hydroxy-6-metoxy-1,4-benzoquinol methylase
MNYRSDPAGTRHSIASQGDQTHVARSLLSGSDNVTLIETVSAEKLITCWQTEFQIDITKELNGVPEIFKYRCNDTGLSYFSPKNIAGSDWFYEQLELIPWYYQKDKWEYRIARHELRQCESVFEVGCGTGEFLKILGEDAHDVAGIELNGRAAALARQADLNVSDESLDQVGTIHKEEFDAVCSFQVLEHVSDPASFIRTMIGLVKPGGRLVFAVPNSGGFEGLGYDLLQNPPHHMSWWTADCFRSLPSLFPIGLEKILAEPLAREHIENYLLWHIRHLRERSRHYRWIFNWITLRIYRRFLMAGLRRFCTGHALYAQFVKL